MTCWSEPDLTKPVSSIKPKPTCVAPRASVIKEQGFSEAKWTFFAKWCLSNQVDLGHPYKVNSCLPTIPVPGQEVTAKYH